MQSISSSGINTISFLDTNTFQQILIIREMAVERWNGFLIFKLKANFLILFKQTTKDLIFLLKLLTLKSVKYTLYTSLKIYIFFFYPWVHKSFASSFASQGKFKSFVLAPPALSFDKDSAQSTAVGEEAEVG